MRASVYLNMNLNLNLNPLPPTQIPPLETVPETRSIVPGERGRPARSGRHLAGQQNRDHTPTHFPSKIAPLDRNRLSRPAAGAVPFLLSGSSAGFNLTFKQT
jgi:hypothetical protein